MTQPGVSVQKKTS